MRRIALILCLLCFYNLRSQSNIDLKKFSQAKDTIICFNCVNIKSKAVTEFTKLMEEKEYDKIKELMLSNNAAEKFLAAATCQKLFSKKKIQLTRKEEDKIKEIFNSKDLVYTYSNDTYIQIKPIRFYVYDKEERIMWGQIQRWIDKLLK